MLNLKDKTAIVTGGGSGIGNAIARHLAEKGCNLILTGRDVIALDETKTQCEMTGVKTYCITADLEDYKSIDSLYDTVMQLGLGIDVFVLNAGISQRDKAFETDFSVDEKIMQVDYFSGIYLLKKFRHMIMMSKHVQIAVTTSLSGLFGFPLRSAYCAAKHAMFGFYESLELEYDNINVTFIIPGRINTQISLSALCGDGTAYSRMDAGQADGLDVDRCGASAVKAIERQRHRQLIGGKELLMAYIHKYCLWLYYRLSRKISAI